ncbi:MAG: TraR/DksA C4-type zinc finger protein [Gammaproteobacteria bacterium]|nr:TraR/DksA C4-type zinc finger protein [Gammaproteobacteria bacterium]
MDDADRAQVIIEQELAALLAMLAPQPAAPPVTARACRDCGGDIPGARLRAHPPAMRCITCQLSHEQYGT